MTDFFLIYDTKEKWKDINKLAVHNILDIYKDQAHVHIEGVDNFNFNNKIRTILRMMNKVDFKQGIFMDTDCILNKKLDVFDSEFDIGLTLRTLDFLYTHQNYKIHQYFNSGVLFLRPSGKPFIEEWVNLIEKRIGQGFHFKTLDQATLADLVLEGSFSRDGLLAYKEGLKPGITIQRNNIKVRIFDCAIYNKIIMPLYAHASIWHFNSDEENTEIRLACEKEQIHEDTFYHALE